MSVSTGQPAAVRCLRASIILLVAIVAGLVTWRLRPTTPSAAADSDTDIVAGCAWLVWVLVGYLAVAVGATAALHLTHSAGLTRRRGTRLAPAGLRRLVDASITVGVCATVLGTSGLGAAVAASAAPAHATIRAVAPLTAGLPGLPGPQLPGTDLDWPGLVPVSVSTVPPIPHHRTPPDHGLLGGRATSGQPGDEIVVRAGDTLWSLAERQLGPDATSGSITATWHALYSANRDLIGPDPGLIHPGQRLSRPPVASTSSPDTAAPVHERSRS